MTVIVPDPFEPRIAVESLTLPPFWMVNMPVPVAPTKMPFEPWFQVEPAPSTRTVPLDPARCGYQKAGINDICAVGDVERAGPGFTDVDDVSVGPGGICRIDVDRARGANSVANAGIDGIEIQRRWALLVSR